MAIVDKNNYFDN